MLYETPEYLSERRGLKAKLQKRGLIFRKKTKRSCRKAGLVFTENRANMKDPRSPKKFPINCGNLIAKSSEKNEDLAGLEVVLAWCPHTQSISENGAFLYQVLETSSCRSPRCGRFRPTAVKALDHPLSSIRGKRRRAKTNSVGEDKQAKYVLQAKKKKKKQQYDQSAKRPAYPSWFVYKLYDRNVKLVSSFRRQLSIGSS